MNARHPTLPADTHAGSSSSASGPGLHDAGAGPIRRPLRIRPLTLLFLLVLCIFIGRLPAAVTVWASNLADWEQPIEDVRRALTDYAVDPVDQEALQRGAINGMLESLDDDYAEYVPPIDQAEFEKELTGQYSGIGAEVDIRDGWLTITSPMDDSPALKAGIMANDRVIRIGDKSTYNLSVEECIRLLTGPEGTPVTFTVLRNGREMEFNLTRRKIIARSVRGVSRSGSEATADGRAPTWNYLIDPVQRIAYLRLSQFTPTAGDELIRAISRAYEQAGEPGLSGLILDLRENPGGALETAVQISDAFLGKGEIVSIRPRNGKTEVFRAESDALDQILSNVPVLIMADGLSASASEIVSGALQDHKRAVVLGSRTFGKGLVQNLVPLSHQRGGQVKFTTARYYLPSGRLIQRSDESTRWGVDPDPGFFIPETNDEIFERLTRRRELDVLRTAADEGDAYPVEEHWDNPTWIKETAKDAPLSAALSAMRERASTGAWKPVSDLEVQSDGIALDELKDLRDTQRTLALELGRISKQINTLEHAGLTGVPLRVAPDLWPDDLDLRDGVIVVRDKDDKVIASVRITGRDIERWISNADIDPITTTSSPAEPVK